MLKQFFLALIALALTPLPAEAGETIRGHLSQEITLRDKYGRPQSIPPGPVAFEIESKGWFLDSEFTLLTERGEFKFKIPRKTYTNNTDVIASARETGQPFSIASFTEAPQLVKAWRATGTTSCSTPGYCMACSPGMDFSGNITTDCSLKFNLSCPDEQDAIFRHELNQRHYVIQLKDAANPEKVVEFRAPMKPQEKRELEKVTSTCGGGKGERKVIENLVEGIDHGQRRLAGFESREDAVLNSRLAPKKMEPPVAAGPSHEADAPSNSISAQ